MNKRVHVKRARVNESHVSLLDQLKRPTSDGQLPNQVTESERRSQSKSKTNGWSLRAISNYLFSRNLLDENRSTHKISRTDEVNGAHPFDLAREQTGEGADDSVYAPEEREAWRFVDTVYETALTRVS